MRHIVLCAFRDDLTAEELSAVIDGFSALSDLALVAALEYGENVSPEGLGHGFTHCFTLDFATAEDRDSYLVDPTHLEFVDVLTPTLKSILVVDYEPTTR